MDEEAWSLPTDAATNRNRRRWQCRVAELAPAYFASVMATGIISVALWLVGWRGLSDGFWVVAAAVYLVLLGANGLRAGWARPALAADLRDPTRLFGFFSFVAGSGVLGIRFIIGGWPAVGLALGAAAAAVWLVLTYWAAYRLLDGNDRPASQVVNGTWLLLVVGDQALAVMASLLATVYHAWATLLLLGALLAWGTGIVFYLVVILAVMGRLFFSVIRPQEATPLYWINMGALAITTLAGSHLALAAGSDALLKAVEPFIEGFTLILWGLGSWWIPLLFLLGWWRHVRGKVPLTYDPAWWSMVFPLGMYTVATATLAQLAGLSSLTAVVPWGLGAALMAWTATAAGCLAQLGKSRRTQRP